MASASISCREMYKVLGETVVSEFVSQFGGRHPRRMVRTVLFRMVEKVRNRTMTNLKGYFCGHPITGTRPLSSPP